MRSGVCRRGGAARDTALVHVRDLVCEEQRLGIFFPDGQGAAFDEFAFVLDGLFAAALALWLGLGLV